MIDIDTAFWNASVELKRFYMTHVQYPILKFEVYFKLELQPKLQAAFKTVRSYVFLHSRKLK